MSKKTAYRLSVLIVEREDGAAALACRGADTCAVGRGASVESAVSSSVRELERGHVHTKSEAKELMRNAEDIWGEEFKRAAMGEARPKRHRKRSDQ